MKWIKALFGPKDNNNEEIPKKEYEEISEEEKCAEAMRKIQKDKVDEEEEERQQELSKKIHLDRCKKVLAFLKERQGRCFTAKLLAKESQAEDEEEAKFFGEFSSSHMYHRGYPISIRFSFRFFTNVEGEEFFTYDSQK